jgi:hypothetical protein
MRQIEPNCILNSFIVFEDKIGMFYWFISRRVDELDNFINEGSRFSQAAEHELHAPHELQLFLRLPLLPRGTGRLGSPAQLRPPPSAQGGPALGPVLRHLAPHCPQIQLLPPGSLPRKPALALRHPPAHPALHPQPQSLHLRQGQPQAHLRSRPQERQGETGARPIQHADSRLAAAQEVKGEELRTGLEGLRAQLHQSPLRRLRRVPLGAQPARALRGQGSAWRR